MTSMISRKTDVLKWSYWTAMKDCWRLKVKLQNSRHLWTTLWRNGYEHILQPLLLTFSFAEWSIHWGCRVFGLFVRKIAPFLIDRSWNLFIFRLNGCRQGSCIIGASENIPHPFIYIYGNIPWCLYDDIKLNPNSNPFTPWLEEKVDKYSYLWFLQLNNIQSYFHIMVIVCTLKAWVHKACLVSPVFYLVLFVLSALQLSWLLSFEGFHGD